MRVVYSRPMDATPLPRQPNMAEVSTSVDSARSRAFRLKLTCASFLLVLADGYDINLASFAGRHIMRAWGLPDAAALAPFITASVAGMLCGAPLAGMAGDRLGRRTAVIAANVTFGMATLLAATSHAIHELAAWRFVAGLGLGGLLPNIIALNAELAPPGRRARAIITMFCGVTIGGTLAGALSPAIASRYGWPALFVVGGLLPLALAVVAWRWLPESPAHLRLRADPHARRPRTADPAAARGVGALFRNGRASLTLALWACFACNLMAFYFIQSWLPIVLAQAHVTVPRAAQAGAFFQAGGTLGALLLAPVLDRRGLSMVAVLFAAAVPAISAIGYAAGHSDRALFIVVTCAGVCSLGLQFGLNAASALVYPTTCRASGSGWALGIGRIGSLAGPVIGAWLIARGIPLTQLYLYAALPSLAGTIAATALWRLHARHAHGLI